MALEAFKQQITMLLGLFVAIGLLVIGSLAITAYRSNKRRGQ